PDEPDRAWMSGTFAAGDGSWNGVWDGTWSDATIGLFLLDQPNSFADAGVMMTSRLKTAMFDANRPFQRKLFVGLRVNAQAAQQTTIDATVLYDHGMPSVPPTLMIAAEQFGMWNG